MLLFGCVWLFSGYAVLSSPQSEGGIQGGRDGFDPIQALDRYKFRQTCVSYTPSVDYPDPRLHRRLLVLLIGFCHLIRSYVCSGRLPFLEMLLQSYVLHMVPHQIHFLPNDKDF